MSLPPTGPREPSDPFERPDHELGEPRDAHDPVAAFFAREREDVQPLPADDLRWQRITREARGRRHRGPLRWVAAVAAVLLLGGGAATLVGQHRTETVASAPRPTVTKTVYVDPSPTAAVSPQGSTTGGAAGAPGSATMSVSSTLVPSDLQLVSVSSVASGRLWGLGSATCSGRACALVVTSTDRGATWSVAGQVPGVVAGAARPVSGGAAGVGAASSVTDVRFADDRTGWVFGAQTLRTTDGGRTWAPYAHGGGPVLALETDGQDVVLAAAEQCSSTLCTGDVTVSRASVGASSAASVGAPYGVGQGFLGLDVAWRAGTAYVSVVGAGGQVPPAVAVGASSLTPLSGPDCGSSTGGRGPFVAAADGSQLQAYCLAPGSAGSLHLFAPQSSTDGSTWTPGPSGATVSVPDAPVVVAAAADAQRLVVASGGPADAGNGVQISVDGGASWAAPTALTAPTGGFGWLGAAGGGTYLALPAVPDGSFWRSTDAGRTWTQIRVAG